MSWEKGNFAYYYTEETGGVIAVGNRIIHLDKKTELPLLKNHPDIIKQIDGQASLELSGSDPIISVLAKNSEAVKFLLDRAGLSLKPSL